MRIINRALCELSETTLADTVERTLREYSDHSLTSHAEKKNCCINQPDC